MTITSSISTIADSIAGLSISGVTVKDIDQIPDSVRMLCPILIPDPNNFVSNYSVETMTFGTLGAQKMNSKYALNYIYLHCEVGSGVNTYAPYSGIVSKLQTILIAIFGNDVITGLVDMKLGSIGKIGVISDPANNNFWGVTFSLNILEYNQ